MKLYILYIKKKPAPLACMFILNAFIAVWFNDFGAREDGDYTETCGMSVIVAEYIECKTVHFLVLPDF